MSRQVIRRRLFEKAWSKVCEDYPSLPRKSRRRIARAIGKSVWRKGPQFRRDIPYWRVGDD